MKIERSYTPSDRIEHHIGNPEDYGHRCERLGCIRDNYVLGRVVEGMICHGCGAWIGKQHRAVILDQKTRKPLEIENGGKPFHDTCHGRHDLDVRPKRFRECPCCDEPFETATALHQLPMEPAEGRWTGASVSDLCVILRDYGRFDVLHTTTSVLADHLAGSYRLTYRTNMRITGHDVTQFDCDRLSDGHRGILRVNGYHDPLREDPPMMRRQAPTSIDIGDVLPSVIELNGPLARRA